MATNSHLVQVERALDYTFQSKDLLQLSLTSPGADEDRHDGNRGLARVGQAAVQMVVATSGYKNAASRERMNDVQSFIDRKEKLALTAKETGIVDCIKLCERSGPASKYVMSQAMRAIIGAVWEDTNRSLDTVAGVIQRLRYGNTDLPIPELSVSSPSVDATATSDSSVASPAHILPEIPSSALEIEPLDDCGPSFASQTPPELSLILTDLGVPTTCDFREGNSYSLATGTTSQDALLSSSMQEGPLDDWATRNGTERNVVDVTDLPEFDWERYMTSTPLLDGLTEPTSAIHGHSEGNDTVVSVSNSQNEMASPNIKRRGAAIPEDRGAKRRRMAIECSSRWINTYITEEKRRCTEHNMPDPRGTYLTETVLNKVMDLAERHRDDSMRMLIGICSPSSLVSLRATMQTIRNWTGPQLHPPLGGLSALERFRAIEREESNIRESTMLKRCHIWKLWQDYCACTYTVQNDGWVFVNPLQKPGQKRPGNPYHMERTQAVSLLLKQIFPNLEKGSRDFQQKNDKVKKLEKLGRRLSMMTNEFHLGILGSLQCCEPDTGMGTSLNISDEMILALTDKEFGEFISILDSSQGDYIRRFSECTSPILGRILDGTLGETSPFPFEKAEPDAILGLPKGSQDLLSILHW